MFPLQASVDGILRFNYAIPEQMCILSQPNVGVDDNDETTSSNAQVGARKEFTGLPISRQQRETASTEQSKQFDFGGLLRSFYFPSKTDSTVLFFVRMSPISLLCCSVSFKKQVREARIIFTRGCESDWDQTRCVNCCIRTGARIVISTCVNEGYSLYHVVTFVRLT